MLNLASHGAALGVRAQAWGPRQGGQRAAPCRAQLLPPRAQHRSQHGRAPPYLRGNTLGTAKHHIAARGKTQETALKTPKSEEESHIVHPTDFMQQTRSWTPSSSTALPY